MGDAGAIAPPPWGLADNAETLLAVSDLVFIDRVTTGYSRMVDGGKADVHHGFQKDLESVGALIRLCPPRHGRSLSPKFLAGESYGTIRARALTHHLQRRYGLFPDGSILISSIIAENPVDFTEASDLPTALYLPTYAALAHYCGKHAGRTLEELRAEAEALAARDYPWALRRAARLTLAARAEMVARVAAVAGLSEAHMDRADLRLEHQRFFRELLRDRCHVTGRLDGRFVGYDADDTGEEPSYAPSLARMCGRSWATNPTCRTSFIHPACIGGATRSLRGAL